MGLTFAAAQLAEPANNQSQHPPPANNEYARHQKTLESTKTTLYTVHNVSTKFPMKLLTADQSIKDHTSWLVSQPKSRAPPKIPFSQLHQADPPR